MSDETHSGISPASGLGTGKTRWARTLDAIARESGVNSVICKDELSFGDRVFVRTRNSLYSLLSLGDGTFLVSGGWFDKRADAPTTIGVNGCTYGGSAIHRDVVAGCGLFLEFANNVSTTRIQSVRVERQASSPCPTANFS